MQAPQPPAPAFLDLWALLYSNGGTNFSKFDCCSLWETLAPQKQVELFNNISLRLEQGRYVSFNAYQAMKESLREIDRQRRQLKQPTNLNGTARGGRMLERGQAAIALYNGQAGIYTNEDIRLYNLQLKR